MIEELKKYLKRNEEACRELSEYYETPYFDESPYGKDRLITKVDVYKDILEYIEMLEKKEVAHKRKDTYYEITIDFLISPLIGLPDELVNRIYKFYHATYEETPEEIVVKQNFYQPNGEAIEAYRFAKSNIMSMSIKEEK